MNIEERRAKQHEAYIIRKMASCRHFTGVGNETCDAGVRYEEAHPTGTLLPCIPFDSAVTPQAICALKSCWSREEAEDNHRKMEERSAQSMIAMVAAHADAKEKGFGKKNGGVSSLKCPVCEGGTLRYSVASYNGHMHAGCTTEGCVSWME